MSLKYEPSRSLEADTRVPQGLASVAEIHDPSHPQVRKRRVTRVTKPKEAARFDT